MYRQISKIYRQTLTLSKYVCVLRASGASELRKFWYFYILTLLFFSIFCRYSRYFVGTNDMLVGLHVPTNFLIYRQTLTLSKCMCMRLSGARASLENFGIFTFLICYFFQYFVGTSDTLSVQITCLSAHMYRQISKCTDKNPEKSIIGGGSCPPAPPSGYANGQHRAATETVALMIMSKVLIRCFQLLHDGFMLRFHFRLTFSTRYIVLGRA